MKNIFIVGARGYHAKYGGWETFVSNLVDHYQDKNTKFYISMYTDDPNLKEYEVSKNITVTPIYVKNMGSATMFFYSIYAFRYYLKYIEKQHIDCGMKIYDKEKQDTHAGGSGCGCSAVTFVSYVLPKIETGEWKRVLFVPTGALLSKVSYTEGQSVPGIAQAVVVEHC